MKITEIIETMKMAGVYGSEDGVNCWAVVELVHNGDAEHWWIRAKDGYEAEANWTPMDEWHGRTLTLSIPCGHCLLVVSDSDHDKLLDALAPIADDLAKVAAGHSVEWDGSNHWGRLTQDAQDALKRARDFCDSLPPYEDITGTSGLWLTRPRDSVIERPR